MEHRKPSKVTQKDRYGNQVTYEYAPEIKPMDPTAIAIEAMKNDMEVPEMAVVNQSPPQMDHPGGPQGSDTVPAWLTPGEFVVNAEAMRMPGVKEQVEQINNHGRAQQKMQGGSIPSGYNQGGQIPFLAGQRLNMPEYQDDGGWITDDLLDKLAETESGWDNEAVSPVGAIGTYQWLPKSAAQAGYGVKAFDPKDPKAARKATAKYLKNMQKYHGFTPEETLRAYNWGPGNVINHKKGKRKDIPDEALNYPGKILGIENTQGVPAPEGMPVPIARPDRIPQEVMPTPTPRPNPQLTAQDIDDLDADINYASGGQMIQSRNPFPPGSYAHEQFEKNRPGQVEYTPPPVNPTISPDAGSTSKVSPAYGLTDGIFDLLSGAALGFDAGGDVPIKSNFLNRVYGEGAGNPAGNVVPALTDVPGHQMFGGNTNLGGEDQRFEDNTPEEVPWYNNLLGHKLKAPGTLSENEKRLADKQTAENELLAGPEIADEENAIANPYEANELGEPEAEHINNIVKGPAVPIDDLNTDDHKKEIVEKNSTEIAENNANEDGEKQTGPDKNQPGENKSESEVEAKGKEAPKGFVDQAKSALVGAFGDLFDSKELARMGIMYAGSRLLGYSHGGSLQFAAKQYVNRVDSNNANHKKYVQDLAKSGKYTSASVSAYNKSKDIADLQPKGVAINPTGNFKTFYGPNGKKIRAQEVKQGKSTLWVGPQGQSINSSYTEDASAIRGTKEYGERIKKDSAQYKGMLEGLRGQFGTTKIEGKPDLLATDLVPAIAGNKIAKWAADNNVPAEYMGSIVENAYHGAIAHSKQTGEKVRDLTSFLDNQYVISQVGDPLLFTKPDGQTVSGPAVSKLFSQVINASGGKVSKSQAVAGYRAAWTKLSDKEQELWTNKATDEETGFMKFIQNDIIKSIQ